MRHEDCLSGLDYDDALSAFLSVETSVIGFEDDETFTGDMETVRLDFLGR